MRTTTRRDPLIRHLDKLIVTGSSSYLDDYEVAKAFVDALSEDGLRNVAKAMKNTRVRREKRAKT